MADKPTDDQAEPSQEQMVEAIYAHAAQMMQAGMPNSEIEKDLMSRGLDAQSASIVVQNLKSAYTKAQSEAGKKNMLYGALWCIGGTVVTVATMQAAAGGGSYVVAWGAILFGGIQFLRGLFQTLTGR